LKTTVAFGPTLRKERSEETAADERLPQGGQCKAELPPAGGRLARGVHARWQAQTAWLSARTVMLKSAPVTTGDCLARGVQASDGPQSDDLPARVSGSKARLLPTGTDFRKGDAKVTAADKVGDPQGRPAKSGTVTDWSTCREACAKVTGRVSGWSERAVCLKAKLLVSGLDIPQGMRPEPGRVSKWIARKGNSPKATGQPHGRRFARNPPGSAPGE